MKRKKKITIEEMCRHQGKWPQKDKKYPREKTTQPICTFTFAKWPESTSDYFWSESASWADRS